MWSPWNRGRVSEYCKCEQGKDSTNQCNQWLLSLFKPIHFMKHPTTLWEATHISFKPAYLLKSLPAPASSIQPQLSQIHFSLPSIFWNLYYTKIVNIRWRESVYFFHKISSVYSVYFSFTNHGEKNWIPILFCVKWSLYAVIWESSSGSGEPSSEDSPEPPRKHLLVLSCKPLHLLQLVDIRQNDVASAQADHCFSVSSPKLPLHKAMVGVT